MGKKKRESKKCGWQYDRKKQKAAKRARQKMKDINQHIQNDDPPTFQEELQSVDYLTISKKKKKDDRSLIEQIQNMESNISFYGVSLRKRRQRKQQKIQRQHKTKSTKSEINNSQKDYALLFKANVPPTETNCYVRIINDDAQFSYSDHPAHAEESLLENFKWTIYKRKDIYWEKYKTTRIEKHRPRTRKELDDDMHNSINTNNGEVTGGAIWENLPAPEILARMQNMRLSVMHDPFNGDIRITIFSKLSTAKDGLDCLMTTWNCFITYAKFKLANDVNDFMGLDHVKACQYCHRQVKGLKCCKRCGNGPKVCSVVCGKKLWRKKRDFDNKEIGEYGHVCIGCRQSAPKPTKKPRKQPWF